MWCRMWWRVEWQTDARWLRRVISDMLTGAHIHTTYHCVGVLDQLVLGHIVDFLRLLEQVAQEVLQLVRLDVAAVVAVVLAPNLSAGVVRLICVCFNRIKFAQILTRTFMNSTLDSSGLSKRKSSRKFSSIGSSWANYRGKIMFSNCTTMSWFLEIPTIYKNYTHILKPWRFIEIKGNRIIDNYNYNWLDISNEIGIIHKLVA